MHFMDNMTVRVRLAVRTRPTLSGKAHIRHGARQGNALGPPRSYMYTTTPSGNVLPGVRIRAFLDDVHGYADAINREDVSD